MVHDFTGTPSTSTVQAPQLVVSQPMWVPVRPSVSRRKWTSSSRVSTSAERSSPLTDTVSAAVCVVSPTVVATSSPFLAGRASATAWRSPRSV